MKEVRFVLVNLPPQPRNQTHEKTPRGIRLSDMAKAFQDDIRGRLANFGKKNYFERCDSLTVSFTIYTPKAQFFTREGKLSKTSIDLDAHKLFLDELAKHFGFNDGLIWDFNPIKLPIEGEDWAYEVRISGEENTTWPVANIAFLTANLPESQILY